VDILKTDFSLLEGTCCYCSAESAALIRAALSDVPLRALHVLGTGDYHYVTLFYLERITVPFELLLFDHHPDDQRTAFGGDLLSCGSWMLEARQLPMLKAAYHIGSVEDMRAVLPDALPLYLSIDLDVLSEEYMHTDWDQGTMSIGDLLSSLARACDGREILGVDLCGGLTPGQGASQKDLALNYKVYDAVEGFFLPL